MRRSYPVSFPMIEQGQQFKKSQRIDVRVETFQSGKNSLTHTDQPS